MRKRNVRIQQRPPGPVWTYRYGHIVCAMRTCTACVMRVEHIVVHNMSMRRYSSPVCVHNKMVTDIDGQAITNHVANDCACSKLSLRSYKQVTAFVILRTINVYCAYSTAMPARCICFNLLSKFKVVTA